jgi:peptidoglycan/LPS O-acetylase OafA/YrhL
MNTINTKTYFKEMDFLRFIAAFSVVIYHFTLFYQESVNQYVKMFMHNLGIGVDLFFIISGFLIVYLLITEKEKTKTISLYKFYVRRILRIFPLYYLIVGISYLLFYKSNPEIQFSKYLLFIGNFWMIDVNSWTVSTLNPLWSICIEEHFYLLIPVLLLLLQKKSFPYLFYFIIFCSLFFRIYITENIENNWMDIYCHTLSKCDLLAFGGLFAYYFQIKKLNYNIPIYLFYCTLFCLMLFMFFVESVDYTTWYYAGFRKYIFAIPMLILFYAIIIQPNKYSFINKITNNKLINYLGKISFGLYIYHSLISEISLRILNRTSLKIVLLNLVLTIILASLSFELFEKQILKLKIKFEV